MVLIWLFAHLRGDSWSRSGGWRDPLTVQEDHFVCRSRHVVCYGKHRAHQYVHHGRRLWAVLHVSSHLRFIADHPLASASRSSNAVLGGSERGTNRFESDSPVDSNVDSSCGEFHYDLGAIMEHYVKHYSSHR